MFAPYGSQSSLCKHRYVNTGNSFIEYGKTQTPCFNSLGPETEEKIKLAKNKIHFDL